MRRCWWSGSNNGHQVDMPYLGFWACLVSVVFLITRFMGPTWGPSGADRTQVGPMLAPWTFLSGIFCVHNQLFTGPSHVQLLSISDLCLKLSNDYKCYFFTGHILGCHFVMLPTTIKNFPWFHLCFKIHIKHVNDIKIWQVMVYITQKTLFNRFNLYTWCKFKNKLQ